MTMATSSLYGVNSILSIGRVQTPTLKLVVDRDAEIESFKPKEYFVLSALFQPPSSPEPFWATWKPANDLIDVQEHCFDINIVENISAKIEGWLV